MITRKIVITFAMSFVIIGCEGDKSTSPQEPELTLLGTYDYGVYIDDIFVSDQFVYIVGGESGMTIVSALNPESPETASSYGGPPRVLDVFVSGDYAFLASGDSGVSIVDISDPFEPQHAGSYKPSGYPYFWVMDVFVAEDYLYLGPGRGSGLEILDISNPRSPVFLGSCFDMMSIAEICVSGDMAYVLTHGWINDASLFIADISDPYHPDSLGHFNLGWGGNRRIHVLGDYAYFSSYAYPGFAVLDVSDPSDPELYNELDTPGRVMDIFIDVANSYVGMNAYVADADSGLQIVNILSPHNPSITASYDISGYASLVFQENEYIYLVKQDTGVMIFRYAPPIT